MWSLPFSGNSFQLKERLFIGEEASCAIGQIPTNNSLLPLADKFLYKCIFQARRGCIPSGFFFPLLYSWLRTVQSNSLPHEYQQWPRTKCDCSVEFFLMLYLLSTYPWTFWDHFQSAQMNSLKISRTNFHLHDPEVEGKPIYVPISYLPILRSGINHKFQAFGKSGVNKPSAEELICFKTTYTITPQPTLSALYQRWDEPPALPCWQTQVLAKSPAKLEKIH